MPPEDVPDRVRMPLLELVTSGAMDEDYQHAADRRRAAGTPAPPGRPRRTAMAVVAVFGLLIAVAALQNSRNAEVAAVGRAELIDQITERRDELQAMQGTIADLREQNAFLNDRLAQLTADDRAAGARVQRLGALTGVRAVTGPGVRIVLDDSPDGSTSGIVRDEDLAALLDGLWGAGAEAIAVNGQRLTVQTGIRNVGRAIHVNNEPLTPPYTVEVIGNPNNLQARFVESRQGQLWFALRSTFGFTFEMSNADELRLPGVPMPHLRSASTLQEPTTRMEVPQ